MLPLAHPALHAGAAASRQITVKVYGKGDRPFTLYEDDDSTLDALRGKNKQVVLSWDSTTEKGSAERINSGKYPRYEITHWERVQYWGDGSAEGV